MQLLSNRNEKEGAQRPSAGLEAGERREARRSPIVAAVKVCPRVRLVVPVLELANVHHG